MVIGKYTQTLKDARTGYGLPFRFDYEKTCPGRIIENSMNNIYSGLKSISNLNEYISIYSYETEKSYKNAKEILKKIKEKNGFTHNCVDGKFE